MLLLAAGLELLPSVASAHGATGAPGISTLWTWEFDPYALVPGVVAATLYMRLVARVNALHPGAPVQKRRIVSFYLGLATFVIAVASPIAVYDDDLFSAHMIQHMLLVFAVPPLLLLSAPMTLLLRAAQPRLRRRWLLPLLHSTGLKILLFPVVTWLAFVVTLWGTHFTQIYDEAVQNLWLHRLEHFFYVGTALLFWWPIVHVDPGPWRIPHPAKIMYLALAMAQLIFFSLVLVSVFQLRGEWTYVGTVGPDRPAGWSSAHVDHGRHGVHRGHTAGRLRHDAHRRARNGATGAARSRAPERLRRVPAMTHAARTRGGLAATDRGGGRGSNGRVTGWTM
ncbi:MAG: cytochrome c oxidase assembly protein [Dehalococcoidia bacterium]|nr:cytochrome c oxidase assembly protein [Dehalococcoidia bacterium]